MIGLRRLHKRTRNSLSMIDITPESSPITVTLSPHRSTKTPRKSPINIGSPKTHSLLPERLSKTPRKLPVTLSSPVASDESLLNKSNDKLLSLNTTTKLRKKLSPKSKTPKIVLRKSKSTKVKKITPKKNVTPKKLVINNKNITSDAIYDGINDIKTPQVLLRRVSASLLSSKTKSKPITAVSPIKKSSPRKSSGSIPFNTTNPTVEITDDEVVETPPKSIAKKRFNKSSKTSPIVIKKPSPRKSSGPIPVGKAKSIEDVSSNDEDVETLPEPIVTRLSRSAKNSPIAVEKPTPRKSSGPIPFNITNPTVEITDDEVEDTISTLSVTTRSTRSSKNSPAAVEKPTPRKNSGPIPFNITNPSLEITDDEVVETPPKPSVTRFNKSSKPSPRKSSGPIPIGKAKSIEDESTNDEDVETLPEPIVTRTSRSSKNSPIAVEKPAPRKSSGPIPFNTTNPTVEITDDEVEDTVSTLSVTTRLSRSSKNSPIVVEKLTPKKISGTISFNKTDDEVIATTPLKQITTRSSKNSPNPIQKIESNEEISNDTVGKTPLKAVITSRFHRNSKLALLTNDDNKLTSSTPRERNGKSQNLHSTSILSVDTFYGTSSPRTLTRSNANKSIEIENESFPLISDDDDDNNNTFEISGINSMKDNVLSSSINNKSIDKDNKDDTYELIPKVKDSESNDTYELEEPKTPSLKKRATKRSIDNNNHDDDNDVISKKRICKVRFESPSINKLNNSTINKVIVNKNTRKATPSCKNNKNNENKNDDKINRRSTSMINLSINNKTPNSIIKKRSNSVVNDNRGKLSAVKAQNESSNRLSKPRQSLTCEKKKPDNINNNNKITSSAKKIPNFAQIHQKKFAQMESLVDAKKRIEVRHNALINNNTNNNNVNISKNGQTVGIVKPVRKIITNDPSTIVNNNNNGAYNKFGFKLRKTDATQAITKEVTSTKIQAKKEDKRQILKGVRSNRRFELMMKSRNIK
ncbi:putative uncharacterized protein DDB_G0277255 [Aphidius gifuensis]|nr:putative uncharacterized protein DDB_G0277255 [Aphidius gifuensis]